MTQMAQGVNSTKTGARPSHEAIEQNAPATEVGRTEQQKIDDMAMESAKRSTTRTRNNEDDAPVFSK